MSLPQSEKDFGQKILEGVRKAYRKLVEETALRGGTLVVERNGQVLHVPAAELLKELNQPPR
jgi:hypothetical protein